MGFILFDELSTERALPRESEKTREPRHMLESLFQMCKQRAVN